MTILFKTYARAFLAAAFVFLCAAPAMAASQPDASANPVLATILKTGAKLYYLGNQAGFDGWFIVKNGEVQVAYALPGGQNAIIGGLFGPDGSNISSQQIQSLLTANRDLYTQLTASMGNPSAVTVAQAQAATAAQPVTAATAVTAASVLLPPGERLMKDLQNAAGVNVGYPSAPLLMMVMDPDCPHCRATWRLLRDAVMKNNLQIRLVPVGQNAERERAAAQLLHVAEPLGAWDKYVSGDKSQLAGTPDPALLNAVKENQTLADSWHMEMTPFLVYRAKDDQVKIVQGELTSASSVLDDIK